MDIFSMVFITLMIITYPDAQEPANTQVEVVSVIVTDDME